MKRFYSIHINGDTCVHRALEATHAEAVTECQRLIIEGATRIWCGAYVSPESTVTTKAMVWPHWGSYHPDFWIPAPVGFDGTCE